MFLFFSFLGFSLVLLLLLPTKQLPKLMGLLCLQQIPRSLLVAILSPMLLPQGNTTFTNQFFFCNRRDFPLRKRRKPKFSNKNTNSFSFPDCISVRAVVKPEYARSMTLLVCRKLRLCLLSMLMELVMPKIEIVFYNLHLL